MPNKLELKIDTAALKNTVMNFIVPLVCFGASAALVLIIIYPSAQKLPQLQSELRTKVTLRTTLDEKISALNKLTDYKSVLEENLSLTDKVLVSDDNVPYLLNQIDQISRNVGFEVMRLNYGIGSTTELDETEVSSEFVAVNLGVVGTYEQIIAFLQNIEKAARIVDVSNLRYSIDSNKDTEGILGLSFLLYSPYLRVNSSATTDDPISLDLSNPEFIKTINFIKGFTIYENLVPSITVKVEEKPLSEVEAPEVEPTPEEEETTPSAN